MTPLFRPQRVPIRIQEFGIDIVGEDNKTIVHHKVAARVVCVFSDQDAQAAARAEAQQSPSSYGALGVPGPSGAAGAFSFAPGTAGAPNGMPGGAPRRSAMQPQGLVGMGGMGGNARPPGKSGLTFDHILSRLQGELQKSRETGSELHSLQGAMSDIHETLGGNIVRERSVGLSNLHSRVHDSQRMLHRFLKLSRL